MSLTASLLKGAKVDSSLDSLFKNSAGPALGAKTQEPVQPRKPKVTDVDEPKIKQKNPKPKAIPQQKKQQQKKKQAGEADSDNDQDVSEQDDDEDEDEEEETNNKNKKKAAKKSVEEKYETKKASEAKKKQQQKAKTMAPKETQDLLKKQTKYDYGDEEDDSKPEDLVHESLRNKRKASEEDSVEDAEAGSPSTKKTKSNDDEEEDSDDENDDKANSKKKKADDPERRARTLFVGNLSVSAISKGDFKTLKQRFSEYGTIESIRFRSVAFSELLPRKIAFITGKLHPERDVVNAYIVYKEKESIAKAVAGMNGQLFLNKHVRVDNADGEKNHNPKKSVFVGNLAFDAQEEALWNFFKDSGDIENVRIIRDRKTNLGKGFAYVQFQDRASVDLALRLHDTKMGSRKLRVIRCKKIEVEANSTNGMQRHPQQQQKQHLQQQKGGKRDQHSLTAPGTDNRPMTGAAKRLALKAAKAKGRHTVTKGGDAIVEGERATKGAKIDLGIKKGKAKVKANVPKKKKFKAVKK
ncbi:Nucleolar protein 12 [Actinomortierella ambigua]|nr:Nucleolar protein 12 [Actinomortierella ambigua]